MIPRASRELEDLLAVLRLAGYHKRTSGGAALIRRPSIWIWIDGSETVPLTQLSSFLRTLICSSSVSQIFRTSTGSAPAHIPNMQRHSFQALNSTFVVDSEYQFQKELGQGAYGCVVSAKHRRSGEGCAIKKITNINTKVCHPFPSSRTDVNGTLHRGY